LQLIPTRYGFISPFQGLKGVFGAFTQGVALGYIILPFQGDRRLRVIFIAVWLNSHQFLILDL